MTIGKLVRNRVPEIIESRGQRPVFRKIPKSEMLHRLNLKLREEVDEVVRAEGREYQVEELADVLEVVYAYAEHVGSSRDELESIRVEKLGKRGGFDEGIFLVSVEEPLSEEEVKKREEEEILARAMANPVHKGTKTTIELPSGSQVVLDQSQLEKLKEIT